MAERMIISGFDSGVKKWASEATAKQIAEILGDMHDLAKKDQKALEKLAKASGKPDSNGDLDAASIREFLSANDDAADSQRRNTTVTDENSGATRKASKETGMFGKSLISIAGMIGTAFGASIGAMFAQANAVAALNSSGIQLASATDGITNELTSFGVAAANANLSFDELSSLAKEYGSTLNRFGIQAFARTSRSVTKSLESLGITASESSELVAEFLRSQRFLGYQRNMTEQQQNRSAQRMIKEIDKYSMAFGDSRTELMKSVSKSLEQVDVQAFLNTQSESVQGVFRNLSTQLSGQDFEGLQTSLMQAIANPITQTSDLFEMLRKGGAVDAMNALTNLGEAAKSGDQALADISFDKFMKTLESSDVNLAQLIGEESTMLLDYINQSKLHFKALENQDRLAERETAAGIVRMQNSLKLFSNFFQRISASVLGNPEVIKLIDDSITDLSKIFDAAGPELVDVMSDLIKALVPAAQILIPKFISMLKSLTSWFTGEPTEPGGEKTEPMSFDFLPDLIGKGLMIAIAGVAGAALIGSAISAGIGKLIGGVAFGSSGSGGIFGSMFKGLGKGTGALLKGLAKGLAAFGMGAPKILIGATTIAGVILLIGGAIAGATWMMGKALPTFANGLRAFESLNGDNLANVGKGVMHLGAGLAAMAAAKLGDLFGSMGEAIFGFFGGEKEGPIEMLRKFANVSDELGPGLAKMGKALSVFAPHLLALAQSASIFESMDVDDIADNLKELLSSDINLKDVKLIIPVITVGIGAVDMREIENDIKQAVDNTAQHVDFSKLDEGVRNGGPGVSPKDKNTTRSTTKTVLNENSSEEEHVAYLSSLAKKLYAQLENYEKRNMPRFATTVQKRISDINRQLQGLTKVNGLRLNAEPVTREMAAMEDSVTSLDDKVSGTQTPDIFAQLEKDLSQRQANIDGIISRRDTAQKYLDTGRFGRKVEARLQREVEHANSMLRAMGHLENLGKDFEPPSMFGALPAKIDESTDELGESIKRYMSELAKLGNVKAISTSARVENSPLLSSMETDTNKVQDKKESYQGVPYALPSSQVKPVDSTTEVEKVSNKVTNPEISKTNVAQSAPTGQPEINSLMKEQTKLLASLNIAVEMSNKRLKTLVRINEEKGA